MCKVVRELAGRKGLEGRLEGVLVGVCVLVDSERDQGTDLREWPWHRCKNCWHRVVLEAVLATKRQLHLVMVLVKRGH